MTQAVKMIIDLVWNMYDKVNESLVLDLFGFKVPFFTLAISFIILGFVVSIFWRGVKS